MSETLDPRRARPCRWAECIRLREENAALLSDLTHMRHEAGEGSCADYAVRNRELTAENERLTAERDARKLELDTLYSNLVDGNLGEWCGLDCGTFILEGDDRYVVTFVDDDTAPACATCYAEAKKSAPTPAEVPHAE